jgi:hypothetical protein
MGFWLSHVPAGRFRTFWDPCSRPCAAGLVFFADDGYRTPDVLIEDPAYSHHPARTRRRTPARTASNGTQNTRHITVSRLAATCGNTVI